jgi:hypothetical protein
VGKTQVTVSAAGQTANIEVNVSAEGSVSFNPPELKLKVGESGRATVMAKGADGQEVAVQTQIDSQDKNVVDADPAQPGQFVARSPGQTQLTAVYRGKTASATVSVSGKRFESVHTVFNAIDDEHFDMTIEVLAAGGEGELEYRVFPQGAAPKENWVPNKLEGDSRKATLRTEPLSIGAGKEFHLVVEARDKKTNSVEQYPLTLIRRFTVEEKPQTDSPQPK